jgi:hypothetical protein
MEGNQMAYFDKDTVARWKAMATAYLEPKDHTCASVLTGAMAWSVAGNCGITREAYNDRKVVDAHIQTALETIFPNAVFKDKKVY